MNKGVKQLTREEKLAEARSLLDSGEFEKAQALIDEVRAGDTADKEERALKDLEEKAKEQKEKSKEDKEPVKKEDSKESKENPEDKEPEQKEEAPKDKEPEEKEKRSLGEAQKGVEEMEKVILDGKEVAPEKSETRSFLDYIRSKDLNTRALADTGVKSVDAQAIIPEEIITKARMLPETVVDLRTHVSVQKVSHAQGSYPILESNKAVLASVEELAANPDLEKPQFKEVDYKVATYRGQLAVAQEALDDSDDDLAGIIARHIQRQGLNTANKFIAARLKEATAVAATSIDDIKTQINTGFDPAYRLEFLVSQSFYNAVDQMKDGNGNYLLQPDVTAQSGKQLLGRPVTILADELIGTAKGDKVAFLGQPDAYAVYFDRVQTSVRWVEEIYYGQVLAVAMRFDTKVVDPAAGKYITLTPATPGP